MRIAVLTSLFPSSVRPHEGIFAQRRWSRMRDRGHDVSVTHPLPWAPAAFGRESWDELRRMSAQEERDGVPIRRPRYLHVPRRALGNARAFARAGVAAIESAARPDVVVADYAWPAAVAAKPCAKRGWPFVLSGRGSDVLQVASIPRLRDALRDSLRASNGWCAVSQHLVDSMDELAGAPGRGVLVANGVDFELFRPRDRAEARRAAKLDFDGPLVLVVGHLIERKDPLLALAAFAALRAKHAPGARLAFVGRGALEGEVRAAVEREGLSACVRLVGEASPELLANWYGAADVLLLTSTREGRPNVVLEALASGLSVLATDAGGTAELLVDAPGMLARSRNASELGGMLAALLSAPREPLRLRALAERWSWDAGLDALEALLESAIAQRGSASK